MRLFLICLALVCLFLTAACGDMLSSQQQPAPEVVVEEQVMMEEAAPAGDVSADTENMMEDQMPEDGAENPESM